MILYFFSFLMKCSISSGNVQAAQVDGPLLLKIDDSFASQILGINHSLRRKRLLRLIEKLNNHQVQLSKVRVTFVLYYLH